MKIPVNILLIFFLSAFTLVSDGPQLSRESMKKLNKSMTELYSGHNIEFIKLNLSDPSISDTEILNSDGKWFAIQEKGSIMGWMMADKIWGRYHEFEYVMIMDTALRIINISVLSYPASHGTAVTGKKWLNRFTGYSPDSIPVYGKNIDALSGATISGTSLTEAVAKSLLLMKKMDEQNLLR